MSGVPDFLPNVHFLVPQKISTDLRRRDEELHLRNILNKIEKNALFKQNAVVTVQQSETSNKHLSKL